MGLAQGSASFNPNRVVYLLEARGRRLACSVRTTKLMKRSAFSEADFSDLSRLFQERYAAYLRDEDKPILYGLMQLVGRRGADPLLEGEPGFEVFDKLVATNRAFWAGSDKPRLARAPKRPGRLRWTERPDGRLESEAEIEGGGRAFALSPPVYIDETANVCGLAAFEQPEALAAQWLRQPALSRDEAAAFCLRLAKAFPDVPFPMAPGARLEETAESCPSPALELALSASARVADGGRAPDREAGFDASAALRARLRFRYGKKLVDWSDPAASVISRSGEAIRRAPRNREVEKAAVERLAALGLRAEDGTGADGAGLLNFDARTFALAEGRSWSEFLAEGLPTLEAEGWEVSVARGLSLARLGREDAYSRAKRTAEGWFDFEFGIEWRGERLSLLPLVRRFLREAEETDKEGLVARLERRSFLVTLAAERKPGAGEAALVVPGQVLVPVVSHLLDAFDFGRDGPTRRLRLDDWQLAALAAAGLADEKSAADVEERTALLRRLARGVPTTPAPAPEGFQAALRPYQERGLGWLLALSEIGGHGLLADDMGLGKTAQTLAFILALRALGQLEPGALIVAPTSVLPNWEAEARRFAPSLRVAVWHGNDRDEEALERADATLTTYALLRRDREALGGRSWSLAVLDEAHFIKNAASQTWRAARALRADRRLCLTGTPVENRLEELWALIDFLLPGYLGEQARFRRRMAAAAVSGGAGTAFINQVRRRVSPFLLRRTKEAVAAELPPKTEIVQAVPLAPRQAELYEATRLAMDERVRSELERKGLDGARMTIFSALLRLRQICCDPRLAAAKEVEDRGDGLSEADSAKLEALLERLEAAREEGRRTLVFSQFVAMIELIAAALERRGVGCLTLTGQSRDRAETVAAFQRGERSVFLVSLKAGGFGLNLTAADTVIHYDPWWNPAAERQASDRAHRIGQDKPVFVYKLIAEGTVESRILRLQESKRALAQALLEADASPERLQLDEESARFLFAPSEG